MGRNTKVTQAHIIIVRPGVRKRQRTTATTDKCCRRSRHLLLVNNHEPFSPHLTLMALPPHAQKMKTTAVPSSSGIKRHDRDGKGKGSKRLVAITPKAAGKKKRRGSAASAAATARGAAAARVLPRTATTTTTNSFRKALGKGPSVKLRKLFKLSKVADLILSWVCFTSVLYPVSFGVVFRLLCFCLVSCLFPDS